MKGEKQHISSYKMARIIFVLCVGEMLVHSIQRILRGLLHKLEVLLRLYTNVRDTMIKNNASILILNNNGRI